MAIRSPVPGTIHLATLNGDEQIAIASGAGNVTTTTQAVANLAAAMAGITQLTGDVTAGPGTGSQAATDLSQCGNDDQNQQCRSDLR